MPLTLAIDTSTRTGRVAVAAGETLVFAEEFGSERSHNSQIFAPLDAALGVCGDALARVAVGTGPGSYTGVRIGIAAGLGIAMARGVPIAGFPSALAAAAAPPAGDHAVVGDARRGALYLAEVAGGALAREPRLLDAGELGALPAPLLTFDDTPPVPGATPTHPSASRLATLAATMGEGEFAQLAATPPEPVYLRPPFITQPKKPGKAVPGTGGGGR